MNTIWAVTSGDYDDYQVRAIFEDKATATTYADNANQNTDRWSGQHYQVEEFPWYPTGTQPTQVIMLTIEASIDDDGSTLDPPTEEAETVILWSENWADNTDTMYNADFNVWCKGARVARLEDETVVTGYTVTVVGADHEKVRKVHAERLDFARTLGPPHDDVDRRRMYRAIDGRHDDA